MSVHAQVPLGEPGANAPDLAEIAANELGARPAVPDAIYKSESRLAAQEATISRPAPDLPAARQSAQLVQPLASQPDRIEEVVPRADSGRVIERDAAIPQPLLTEAPGPSMPPMISAALLNSTRDADSRIRPDAQREPTEVHVHIGRIEVIAPPEAPPVKKPPPRASRPTVPLSEYLSKKARP
jgi:hypothetical protein